MASRLIEKQVLYTGKKIRLEIHRLEGEDGQRFEKEIIVHPGAVVILPFADADTIVLIRNRRYAVGQILVELPAGTLDKSESPMNAAGRELMEETGLVAGRLKPLLNFFASPGIMSEKMYVFAAYDLRKGTKALEPGEEIEVFPAKLTDAITMIRTGEIQDGKTIATLLAYDRFYRNPQ
ncbi:MAG: NUDIX hydrolase [Tepidisphaerales bacterium]